MTAHKRLASIIGTGIYFTPLVTIAQEIDPTTKFYQDLTILGLIFSVPIIIVLLVAIASSLEDRRRLKLIERLIDDGRDFPPELLMKSTERKGQNAQVSPAEQRQIDLRRSVWLLFLGLGTWVVLYLLWGDLRTTAWSLIFFFLGGASLVNALLVNSTTANDEGAKFQK